MELHTGLACAWLGFSVDHEPFGVRTRRRIDRGDSVRDRHANGPLARRLHPRDRIQTRRAPATRCGHLLEYLDNLSCSAPTRVRLLLGNQRWRHVAFTPCASATGRGPIL